ncbi:heat shock protein DnaJ domain protein [Thalassoporum mexicanum PCC 7367]|nr:heat shock protein DnaJ domain protein [Pseudanabaena sp. PCC 7367]
MLRSSDLLGQVDMGICKYNANDHYAVLGIPVTADTATIRRRYLKIAKSLHPDVHGRDPQDKEKATQVFAKIVSPAYNALMHERERVEYGALLKLIAKRLMKGNQKLQPESEIARKLLYAPSLANYQKYVKEIAELQYQDIGQSMAYVGQLSELNLVYLATQQGYNHFSNSDTLSMPREKMVETAQSRNPASQARRSSSPSSYSNSQTTDSTTAARAREQTAARKRKAEQSPANAKAYGLVKQAETYINQKQWGLALKELRTALTFDRTDSKCYALLGLVYLHQKQGGMAKASFQQALKINPKQPIARKYMDKLLSKTGNTSNKSQTTKGKSQTKTQTKKQDKQKGGFFGWLGG